jgi:signal transduction histidine kinase
MVEADRLWLSQALINLGSNAIKYNRPDGSVLLSRQDLEDGRIRVMVTDTGIGIPEARQAELFQPFNRLGAERLGIEGAGIGLVITRRVVELMGGELGFTSTPGVGSSFWIDLRVPKGGSIAAAPPSVRAQPD